MKKIKKDILEKIDKGEIKLKPRWEFELVKTLVGGLFLGVLGGLMIMIVFIGMFFDQYKIRELWEYGDIGRDLLISDFPYKWLAIAIITLITAWVGFGKMGTNYRTESTKKILLTIGWILLAVVVTIVYLYLF